MTARPPLLFVATAVGLAGALIGLHLAQLLSTILTVLRLSGLEALLGDPATATASATVAVYMYVLAAAAAVLVLAWPRLGAAAMLASGLVGLLMTKSLGPYALVALSTGRPGSTTQLGFDLNEPSAI